MIQQISGLRATAGSDYCIHALFVNLPETSGRPLWKQDGLGWTFHCSPVMFTAKGLQLQNLAGLGWVLVLQEEWQKRGSRRQHFSIPKVLVQV